MEYIRLGSTGLKVSRIGLGTMTYGTSQWRPWVLDEAASRPFFRRAWEAGVNFFDTADMYSLGLSEEIVGRALRKYARLEEIVIGPARENDGTLNLMGALRTSMATCGYESIHDFQKAEVMLAPAIQTEGKSLQQAQRVGMG